MYAHSFDSEGFPSNDNEGSVGILRPPFVNTVSGTVQFYSANDAQSFESLETKKAATVTGMLHPNDLVPIAPVLLHCIC